MIRVQFFSILIFFLLVKSVFAQVQLPAQEIDMHLALRTALKNEISKIFLGANVVLADKIQWVQGAESLKFERVRISGDDHQGNIHFFLDIETDTQSVAEGWIGFSAWLPALIAAHRIHPIEKLTQTSVITQDVNVSVGLGREYRGILLTPQSELGRNIEHLESVQSILEGQFLTTSAVRRMPDIRRGDRLKIQLVSNLIVLSTDGFAEEPGYLGSNIKAMTTKNKREVMGRLLENNVLEVIL